MGHLSAALYVLFLWTPIALIHSQSAHELCNFKYLEKRTHVRGQISNSEYPEAYRVSSCQQWSIQEGNNFTITISFLDMDIVVGDGGLCNTDYLEIGPTPHYFYCGDMTRVKPYISQRDHVWINFYSDNRDVGSGFLLQYIAGPMPSHQPCLFDEFRCRNNKCIYSIWQCNGMSECGDGSDEENCSSGTHPPTVPSCPFQEQPCYAVATGEFTCLHNMHRCDQIKDCFGGVDEMNCTDTKCNELYEDPFRSFTTPGYPKFYPKTYDCSWTIHVQKNVIQLRFLDFHLESSVGSDYVIIYDGKDEDSDILGRYFGTHRPLSVIESTTTWMYIKFHSDGSLEDKGFNATYQQKGICFGDQKKCSGEVDCYAAAERCDGPWNCEIYGADERGCGSCDEQHYPCGLNRVSSCYQLKERCTGMGQCSKNEDEMGCTSYRCGAHNGTFLCANTRCIYESWRCDMTDDCLDGSDEIGCPMSTSRVIIAAVIGSLICALLLVVAMGCTCKLYALRMHEQYGGPRHDTPVSRITAELMRRQAPPPYHEAMVSSRPFDEVRRDYLDHMRRQNRPRRDPNRRRLRPPRRPRPATPLPSDSTAIPWSTNEDNTNPTIDENPTRQPSSNNSVLIPPTTTSESEGGDSESDTQVEVTLSGASGVTAHWHRNLAFKLDEDLMPSDSIVEEENSRRDVSANCDTASIDTASASCDSVLISIGDDGDKLSQEEITLPSSTSTAIGNGARTLRSLSGSRSSLNSSDSEIV